MRSQALQTLSGLIPVLNNIEFTPSISALLWCHILTVVSHLHGKIVEMKFTMSCCGIPAYKTDIKIWKICQAHALNDLPAGQFCEGLMPSASAWSWTFCCLLISSDAIMMQDQMANIYKCEVNNRQKGTFCDADYQGYLCFNGLQDSSGCKGGRDIDHWCCSTSFLHCLLHEKYYKAASTFFAKGLIGELPTFLSDT